MSYAGALRDVEKQLSEWAFNHPHWEQETATSVLDHVIGVIDDHLTRPAVALCGHPVCDSDGCHFTCLAEPLARPGGEGRG